MTDPRIEAAACALWEQNVGLNWPDDADNSAQAEFREDARIAIAAADAAAWQPIETAPKDRTPILAKIHDNLFPRVVPKRKDLERWNGLCAVISHEPLPEDGFDVGWGFAAPVGCGGFPDHWFAGWMPLRATQQEAAHD